MHFCPLQTKYHVVIVMIMTSKSSSGGKRKARRKRKVFPTIVHSMVYVSIVPHEK